MRTLLRHLCRLVKVDLMQQQMSFLIKKIKKIIKDKIDPTHGLFIIDQLNPNEQNFQNTTDVFNLPPQVQQQLNETALKKVIKQAIIQQLHQKVFQLSFLKQMTVLSMMMNLIHLKSLNQ